MLINTNMHGHLLCCMGRCVIFQVIHILIPIYELCIQTFDEVQRNLQDTKNLHVSSESFIWYE